jgi:hypothetical protein
MPEPRTPAELERAVAVLHQAVAVLRGLLYSARSGDATRGEFDRILDSTNGDTLSKLIGSDVYKDVMRLSESLPAKDRDILLSIKDEPY